MEATIRRHAALIRMVRRDFERLRPRRTALRRQRDGAELDVDALVAAYADRRGGAGGDERFYIDTRPGRRDAAITLLVDVSASTDGWVAGDRRIIDVEKEALLIVGEALTALGRSARGACLRERRSGSRAGAGPQALRRARGNGPGAPAYRGPRA